jgi:PAS domain S-box-containing protein
MPAAPPARPLDFEAFFTASLDLMVIRDAEFRIVRANPAWRAVLGYSPEELEGRPMLDLIHPEDAAESRERMVRVGTERNVDGYVNRYRRADGAYRHLEWRARQEGDLVYGVARDVTERLATAAEMAQARAAAEAANTAKSEFLANMSHEVRTPLNGVIGVAAALARTELAPDQREMVELILTSGQTLERVVSDVLDVSKIEAGRMELDPQPFDLRGQLDGLLNLFRARAEEKGLAYAVDYGEAARGDFLGDAVRLRQVLGNLVANAIKFTAEGEVRVTVDIHDLAPGAQDPGDDGHGPAVLSLEVRDTGIGFDAAAAGRLFQRFSQADGSITRRFGGTGLGLSICQALVGMMGGEIRAASQPGEGSVFQVTVPLPRVRRPAAPPPAAEARPAPVPEAGVDHAAAGQAAPLKVLLAEDHAVNRRVVEMILAPAGVELTAVETGAQALAAWREGDFALVLMDMQMPVMDGLAATRAIRDEEAAAPGRRRTPIVMLSANAMRQHSDEAMDAGADLHLGKPVTPDGLLAAVARALELPG